MRAVVYKVPQAFSDWQQVAFDARVYFHPPVFRFRSSVDWEFTCQEEKGRWEEEETERDRVSLVTGGIRSLP